MLSGDLVVIRVFEFELEALLAQARLEAEGIPSVVLRTSEPHIGFAPPVRLAVRADSVEAVIECLTGGWNGAPG